MKRAEEKRLVQEVDKVHLEKYDPRRIYESLYMRLFFQDVLGEEVRMVTVEPACGHRFVLAGSKVVPKGQEILLHVEAGIFFRLLESSPFVS